MSTAVQPDRLAPRSHAPGIPCAPGITVGSLSHQLGLEHTIARAITFAGVVLSQLPAIEITWNARLKSSAGRAILSASGDHSIELHPGLLRAEAAELAATFLHEVAHVMAYLEYGAAGQGHGREWWEAMIRLGRKPWLERYHDIPHCRQSAQVTLEDLGL